MMQLDILAFAAHPDDVELASSGTIIKHIQAGKKVGNWSSKSEPWSNQDRR